MESPIETDYLIVGAGAAGMAFADSLLTETEVTMTIVDRHHRPGGHWNDAYPFVRLHQPSATYGVNSRNLGSGAKDRAGHNTGLYELASGNEVLSHFDLVMQQQFLPSGRVTYFPMSDVSDDGAIVSLLSGQRREVLPGKIVDGRYSKMTVPSTNPPNYVVAPEAACIPLNDLPRVAHSYAGYVVIGAGKTGMDACGWLLDNGADPGSIRWIMPRDSWLLRRENIQPGPEFFARFAQSLADQVSAVAEAESVDDVFSRLESMGEVTRIDPSVEPAAYHCATISEGELTQLRQIRNVVRQGHVTRIDADQIVLDGDVLPTGPDILHIDCSSAGIPVRPAVPVFVGNRITLQWVRTCQAAFSASFIGHVEAAYEDEEDKNRLCTPIAPANVPTDWLRMAAVELSNRWRWSGYPEIGEWLAESRLDPFTKLVRSPDVDEAALVHLQRYLDNARPAMAKLKELLADS